MDYLYDGSFDGFLTCVYYNYYHEAADGVFPQALYQPSLIIRSSVVVTNPGYAARVYRSIEERLAEESLRHVYYAFLSEAPNKESIILNYLRLGFRMGSKIDSYHTHPHVQPLHKISRKVGTEVHRFLGLLRFADNGRFLHARLAPDHNILPLLADHFAERLKNERWVIEDEKRRLAVVYDGKGREGIPKQRNWYIICLQDALKYDVNEEDPYQELWKLYFNKITIESRRNPRLQTQFVPKRYRKNLVEFEPLSKNGESFRDEY